MYQGLPQGKDLLDTEDVAAYLGVGQVTVWRWCRDGSLPCIKIGREWRIRREALERFLERSERSESLVGRLKEEGRFRFTSEPDPQGGRSEELRRLLSEEADGGRSVWVSFNWAEQIGLEAALKQQEALREVVEEGELVLKTAVLEEVVDEWPGKMLRRAQVAHSGTIWLSESGLALSRVTPPPSS